MWKVPLTSARAAWGAQPLWAAGSVSPGCINDCFFQCVNNCGNPAHVGIV
jgi:hypothetical protein